jgi:hypothetical protein
MPIASRNKKNGWTMIKNGVSALFLMILASGAIASSARNSFSTRYFNGQHSYQAGDFFLKSPIKKNRYLRVNSSILQKKTAQPIILSMGIAWGWNNFYGYNLEAFSFYYFPKAGERSLAVGFNVSKELANWRKNTMVLAGFVRPVFANVKAVNKTTKLAEMVNHTLMLAGLTLSSEAFKLSVFGTQSLYSRNPDDLTTPVNLGQMTGLGVYSNMFGFHEHSAGSSVSYSPTHWVTLTTQLAAVWFKGSPMTQSFSPLLNFHLGHKVELSTGMQWLDFSGSAPSNTLSMVGLTVHFN